MASTGKRSLYLIGIGGTGAKVLEAVTHMAATGVFGQIPVRVLYVDADENNGNLTRSRDSLRRFKAARSACPWLSETTLEEYNPALWSPFGKVAGSKRLDSFFAYNNLRPNTNAIAELEDRAKLGYLFDILYTQEEREASLDVGFRGRPAIGSAIMSQIELGRLSEPPWSDLINRIKADAGEGTRSHILLVGSIFGGTGASGLPTIGRLLTNKLVEENIRNSVQIGVVFLLPYFHFMPSGQVDEMYARADQFGLNTESALRYYLTQASGIFNGVYLLGSPNRVEYSFSTGKEDQKNQAHVIELYAALAIRAFIDEDFTQAEAQVMLMTRTHNRGVSWADIPQNGDAVNLLRKAVRFAYLWLDSFYPGLQRASQMKAGDFAKREPWFGRFFKAGMFAGSLPVLDAAQLQQAAQVKEVCDALWRWVCEFHRYSGNEQVALFRCRGLENLGEGNGAMFADLVAGRNLTQAQRQQEDIANIKLQLQDAPVQQGGVRELVQKLYALC